MKTYLIPLSLAAALWMGSTASAAVVVHAGPFRVGVWRPAVRPIYRPTYVRPAPALIRPVAPIYRPATVPAPIVNTAAWQTVRELRAARIRNAIHQETQAAVQDALNNLANAPQN